MSRGKINLQSNDGSVVGLVLPDGLGSGERQIALGVNLSGITAYHLLQGSLSATINANYVETSATTTRNYTTSDYIFDSLNNKLYDCILASTAGALLTNTTYFTLITAGALQLNTALVPFANGIDSNGTKNTIVYKNETITGLTYTAGKNYVYAKNDGTYGVKPHKPRILASELVRRYAGEQPDYFDVNSNKWFNTDAGSELVTNGKFDVNTTGWSAVVTPSAISFYNGTGKVSYDTNNYIFQDIVTVADKVYNVKFNYDVPNIDNQYLVFGMLNNTFTNIAPQVNFNLNTSGVYEVQFTATSSITRLTFNIQGNSTGYGYIDNVTSFPVEITPTTEITESRNYLNHIVHADKNGQVAYVEELPKIEYKDIVKANKFQGKNALIAYALVDMTATPPAIKSSFNISGCIRVSSGVGNLYLSIPTDTSNVSAICGSSAGGTVTAVSNSMIAFATGTTNYALTNIYVFGGQQ